MTGSEAEASRDSAGNVEPDATEAAPPGLPYGHLALWFWPALLVAGAWWIGLVTTAVQTANPVTLNHQQIRQSALVVEGTVVDVEAGKVRVERTWPITWSADVPDELTLRGLARTGAKEDATYLLPVALSSSRGGFEVTRPTLGIDRKPDGTEAPRLGSPQVYRPSEAAVEQLERVRKVMRTTAD